MGVEWVFLWDCRVGFIVNCVVVWVVLYVVFTMM